MTMNPKVMGPVRGHQWAMYAIARCCGLEFIKHTSELRAVPTGEGHRCEMVPAIQNCTQCNMKLVYRWAVEHTQTRNIHWGPEPAPAQLDLF